ncbi:MAG: CBS domain-containing protein [Dehalococcoidia bacterium]|nr:CBS domain-containing protein [Dehalococcoidia bacterium]
MKVKEIMVQPVIVTSENTTLEEAAQMLLQHCIGCLPVVDAEGKLVGIITESDFTGRECGFPFSVYRAPKLFGEWVPKEGIERIYQAARTRSVKTIMTPCVVTATEEESVTMLIEKMAHHELRRIPVVRQGEPVGIVTRHDLLKLIAKGDLALVRR